MSTTEERLDRLERKARKLSAAVTALSVLLAASFFFQAYPLGAPADARGKPPASSSLGAVEAQAFVLKDAAGNVRGMWSAEKDSTIFAMAHTQKEPSIVMAVASDTASVNLADRKGRKMALALNDKFRSFSIRDDRQENNLYLGTGEDETTLELAGRRTAQINLSGAKTSVALGERQGSWVSLGAEAQKMGLSFVDSANIELFGVEAKNRESRVSIVSSRDKLRRVLSARPEE